MNEIERLAQGFVEATTDLDYAPLPDGLKAQLCDAAAGLLEWRENRVYVVYSATRSVSQSESDTDTH